MRRLALAGLIATALTGPVAIAQTSTEKAVEFRPMAGMFIPTGGMRNEFNSSALVGLQGAIEVNSHVHLVLGTSWTQTQSRFPTFDIKRTDIWQFDAGGELNLMTPMGRSWFFRPFAGGGLGTRMYDYRATGAGGQTCAAAYGALGAEAQRFEGAIRFEARSNVTCFTSPVTGEKKTRNDVGLSLGFVFHMM